MKMASVADPAAAAGRPRRHGGGRPRRPGQGRHRQPRRARLQRDPLRLLLGRQQQRQRLRGPVRQHALLQHGARPRDALRALLADRAGARHRRLARRQEDRARGRRARSPRTARSSWCCSSAPCSSSARSPSCRRSPSARSSSTCRCFPPSERLLPGTDMTTHTAKRPLLDPSLVLPALADSFRRLAPQDQWRNPVMFVCYVGKPPHHRPLRPGPGRPGRDARRLHPRHRALAVVHGALRQLRRGDRRGARQGAGREPRGRQARDHGEEALRGRPPRRDHGRCPAPRFAWATSCSSKAATSSRPTARWSRAWPPWTSPPSPANPRP